MVTAQRAARLSAVCPPPPQMITLRTPSTCATRPASWPATGSPFPSGRCDDRQACSFLAGRGSSIGRLCFFAPHSPRGSRAKAQSTTSGPEGLAKRSQSAHFPPGQYEPRTPDALNASSVFSEITCSAQLLGPAMGQPELSHLFAGFILTYRAGHLLEKMIQDRPFGPGARLRARPTRVAAGRPPRSISRTRRQKLRPHAPRTASAGAVGLELHCRGQGPGDCPTRALPSIPLHLRQNPAEKLVGSNAIKFSEDERPSGNRRGARAGMGRG